MHDCSCGWLSVLQLQILYNKQYGKYVLLFHADTPKFSFPTVGVAMADNVTGMHRSTQHVYYRAFHSRERCLLPSCPAGLLAEQLSHEVEAVVG